MVMDSKPDFRPQMQRLGELTRRGVPMVFLTATIPLHIESGFMKIMKVRPSDIYMFRAPMICPNIAYSVLEYNTRVKEIDTICRLVQEKLE